MIALLLLYWAAVAIIFIVGIIIMIVATANNKPVKPGLRLVILSVILLVIGAGACAIMLSGLGGMH
ncbi:hypothetical protein [Pedobacter panaciterrae]